MDRIPPGNYFPAPPEPRDATPDEIDADRRADRLRFPREFGLCVTCAREGEETMSEHESCDECWFNHVASRKINTADLAFASHGEPMTLVTRDGKRHHVTVSGESGNGIPVRFDGSLVWFDRIRGESEIGYLCERAADHPVFLARVAEREKREAKARRQAERRLAAKGGGR